MGGSRPERCGQVLTELDLSILWMPKPPATCQAHRGWGACEQRPLPGDGAPTTQHALMLNPTLGPKQGILYIYT